MNGSMTLVSLVEIWLMIGGVVAAAFLIFGIARIDEDASGALGFRPLVIPGILLIWPLVLWRWWVLASGRDKWHLRHAPPRRIHGPVALVLAIILALTVITAMALRQTWPADADPVRIAPPAEVNQ